ncbi:Transcription factor [Kalmusia sp. IMI 367209]|nr:Transcription factor [Kalmusia sp. IMI 367209]
MTEQTQEPNGSAAASTTASKSADRSSNADKPKSSKSSSPSKDKGPPAPRSDVPTKTPKKRRKVNHACIYCRRSHMTCDLERPCTRCIKRNIGHLCHDEPREGVKKSKTDPESANGDKDSSKHEAAGTPTEGAVNPITQQTNAPDAGLNLAPPPLPPDRGASTAPLAQPTPVSAAQLSTLTSQSPSLINYNDWNSSSNNNFQDMHQFHPSYMFNTSEISNEYNLLNDFLNNSLMDDGNFYGSGDFHQLFSDASLMNPMGTLTSNTPFNPNASSSAQLLPPPAQTAAGNSIQRPSSSFPLEKAREKYYMTAADPAGADSPEERMNKLLKAKMDAGMLKPFNYVKGYARLNQYMEQNLQSISRVRILRQLDRFRPKFRERVQSSTDVDLVRIEIWFDRSLMEYDRVFASMAIPACCWRRTGEIYRGNKEMARLIHVPMSKLRDGNIALHEILAEPSLVSYWEKFGAIAFDNNQKAILTSCALKNPDPNSKDPEIRCCFSFTVKRDTLNIPSLIPSLQTSKPRFGASRDTTLIEDLQAQICGLPLQASSAVTARQDELEKLGTELWNLSTRLRRDEGQHNGRSKDETTQKNHALCLLRVFSFLLLDSAGSQSIKGRERKNCMRLMKVALKSAKVCIENNEVEGATKVLERAAEYQELLGQNVDGLDGGSRIRRAAPPGIFCSTDCSESVADLFYEMGKDLLGKHSYEAAIRWLERASDIIGEQNLEMLSSEAGELRLSIMQSITQAYMKLNTQEARTKAWHMVKLLEVDYGDKMSISLLKLELLFSQDAVDSDQVFLGIAHAPF